MGSHLWQSIYSQSQVNRVGGKEEEDIYFYGYFHFHLSITVCFAPACLTLPGEPSSSPARVHRIEYTLWWHKMDVVLCALTGVRCLDGWWSREWRREGEFYYYCRMQSFWLLLLPFNGQGGYWGKESRECLSVCLSFLLQKLQVNYRNYQLSCPIIVTVDCCLF